MPMPRSNIKASMQFISWFIVYLSDVNAVHMVILGHPNFHESDFSLSHRKQNPNNF